MIVKTRASLAEKVCATVKEMHPFDTPAILVLPLESVDASYLRCLFDATEDLQEQ